MTIIKLDLKSYSRRLYVTLFFFIEMVRININFNCTDSMLYGKTLYVYAFTVACSAKCYTFMLPLKKKGKYFFASTVI